jgi:hypothetical protein
MILVVLGKSLGLVVPTVIDNIFTSSLCLQKSSHS